MQVDPAGQLHDLRAIPEGSVGLDRRRPGRFGHRQDRLAEVSIDRQADRESHPQLPHPGDQPKRRAGRVGSHDHTLIGGQGGQLRQRQLGDLDQVGGGVGGGVAGSQHAGQRLTGPIGAVQIGQQRMEPKVCL